MEVLVSNLTTGKVRRETMNGRDYIVAQATLIVPGVLNGSRGRLYYPPDEVGRGIEPWNGMPMVVYHPQIEGVHVSARNPKVLNDSGIGMVLENKFDGKHNAELWFDEYLTKNYDKKLRPEHQMLPRLLAGKPIEISTGLFTDNEEIAGVAPDGRPYDAIARNYRPDHLAILPDQIGACSVSDGCGVNVNGSNPTAALIERGQWLTKHGLMPGYGQIFLKENGSGEVWYVGGDGDEEGFSDLVKQKLTEVEGIDEVTYEAEGFPPRDEGWIQVYPKQRDWVTNEKQSFLSKFWEWLTDNAGVYGNPQSKNTGKFKRMGAGTGKGPVHEAAQHGAMTLTDLDHQLGHAAKAEKEALGNNPASWVEDEATWERAKEAAGKNYDEGDDAYWPVVAHIYQRMGGATKKHTENSEVQTTNEQGDTDMPLTREQNIQYLVANCDCWKNKKEVLANDKAFTDDEIAKLKANADTSKKNELVVNSLKDGIDLGDGKTATFDESTKKFVVNAGEEVYADPEEEEEEEDEEMMMGKKKPPFIKNKAKQQPRKPITERLLPDEVAVWNSAAKILNDHKKALVRKLVTNSQVRGDEERMKALATNLMKKDVDDLEQMLLLQAPVANAEREEPAAWFFGNGGGPANAPTVNAEEIADDVAAMTPPTMNYEEMVAERRQAKTA